MGLEAVSQFETTYLPESHETVMRIYGESGELLGEHIMAVDLGREVRFPQIVYGHGRMWYDRDTGELSCRETSDPDYYENLDIDMREWDREQDAHHAVYRREYERAYDDANYGNPYVRWYVETLREDGLRHLKRDFHLLGKWNITDKEPDIKEERGGALDEFLDEFKPQTTPERSDEQE